MARWPWVWPLAAAGVGFSSSALFAGVLHWPRNRFVLGYTLLAGAFGAMYLVAARIRPLVQLERRWRAGLLGGLAIGALLARGVAAQPVSARPAGAALAGALVWLGGVYGTVDALLLTVIPVLSVYGTRPPELMRRASARLRWGGLALVASLGVTAAYHLGFAEFRGPSLVQPLIGNALITVGYLLTGNPLAAILAHIVMHVAAVLHGMGTTVQLPPHS